MLLNSNRELYDYLMALSTKLRERNALELSREVETASNQIAASSTEFLGEARIALSHVRTRASSLTAEDRADLLDVLDQIDAAMNDKR